VTKWLSLGDLPVTHDTAGHYLLRRAITAGYENGNINTRTTKATRAHLCLSVFICGPIIVTTPTAWRRQGLDHANHCRVSSSAMPICNIAV